MKDHPTPETDGSIIRVRDGDGHMELVDCEIARDLERRLAECREALERCEMWLSTYKDGRAMQLVCQQTLTNTAPKP